MIAKGSNIPKICYKKKKTTHFYKAFIEVNIMDYVTAQVLHHTVAYR